MLQKCCYPEPVAGTGAGQDWTGSTTLFMCYNLQIWNGIKQNDAVYRIRPDPDIFSDPPGPRPDTEKIMHFRPDVDLEKLRTSDWNWIQQKKNKDPNGSGEAMLIQLNPEQQH